MYSSKRFIAMCISVVMFITMIYTTEHTPMEIAGAISMILSIYLGVETYKPSNKV